MYRYQQQYQKAWDAYAAAERTFDRLRDSAWLGTIYQQQAICLYQAHLDDLILQLQPAPAARAAQSALDRQLALALELAERAVGICRERNIRAYPSALNRAGRILGFGYRDYESGLSGSRGNRSGPGDAGRLVLAGEHGRVRRTGLPGLGGDWRVLEFREAITGNEEQFVGATAVYSFPDLEGRWEIVRGHLAVREWGTQVDDHDDRLLEKALEYYTQGFRHIADRGFVGSSGSNVIPGAFVTFGELFSPASRTSSRTGLITSGLPGAVPQPGSTMLLAELERLC